MFGKFAKGLTRFYNSRHKVRFQKGTAKTASGKNISSLEEGLAEIAKCENCGCSQCYGHRTYRDVCSGELMAVFVKDCELVVMTECAAMPLLKEYKACREAGTNCPCEDDKIKEETKEPVEDEV